MDILPQGKNSNAHPKSYTSTLPSASSSSQGITNLESYKPRGKRGGGTSEKSENPRFSHHSSRKNLLQTTRSFEPDYGTPLRDRAHRDIPIQVSGTFSQAAQEKATEMARIMTRHEDQINQSAQRILLQKQCLPRLVEIFEASGISHQVGGTKTLPWENLDQELIRIECYVTGWPEICLPKRFIARRTSADRIDFSSRPESWNFEQWNAMADQISNDAVRILPRPKRRAVLFDEGFHAKLFRTLDPYRIAWA
ncbi:hypothetical protein M408DRAFT_10338 [Serendipita vermifera MAFF 305830]|uniref:Uncharacterized protein n=1 Tax=Serendipita vermifera MAFF 305830 TaxID=933852 RepID=A0A0C3B0J3_SERVB|nr:hypothetical protein M408DRAFT_10338 [Serendipita vermifera MAFF 305830]